MSAAPAIAWLIVVTLLLILPGSAFPKENWLDRIGFDKWVHFFLFVLLVFLWCHAYRVAKSIKIFIVISILSVLYGVGMEYVQANLVPNRDFDRGDIVADAVGVAAGFAISWYRYIKK
jgi:hypothetical protein